LTRATTSGQERDFAGYGRWQPRVEWPGQAAIALNIHVNLEAGGERTADEDGENEAVGEFVLALPGDVVDRATQSVFEYETRAGFWRVMRILDEFGVTATINACAVSLERNPEIAAYLGEAPHEISCHGWRWEELWTLSRDDEREHLERAVATIERLCGRRPRGWCSRLMQSAHTRELLVEAGFLYDSDALNDDLPYVVNVAGRRHVVVPLSFTYNDGRFILGGADDPVAFGNYLRLGFDELSREGVRAPKMMTVSLHPRWIGQAARAAALREFLLHAHAAGGVWFATREQIASYWLEHAETFERVDASTSQVPG
jgi:peptidoglycan/xylan/chitin deacetylase (PgdA/CDA1 family)